MRREAKTRKLTVQETLRILGHAKRRRKTDWLIMRLMVESGFTLGEVVGDVGRHAKLPGIQLKDLIHNAIVIRGAYSNRKKSTPIGPHLMQKLLEHKGERTKGALFTEKDIWIIESKGNPFDAVSQRIKRYAEYLGIESMTSGSLMNTLLPSQVPLLDFDSTTAVAALEMSDFYALNSCLEQSIRTLIIETLERYDDWWEEKVPPSTKDYYTGVRKRISESDILLNRPGSKLNYLTFGQLRDTIQFNWEDFKDKFLLGKEKPVFDALDALHQLRTVIAHSCNFTGEEQIKFRATMNDWFRLQSPAGK